MAPYTRLEKILAAGLVLFLLLASIWALESAEDAIRKPSFEAYYEKYGLRELEENMTLARDLLWNASRTLSELKTELLEAERDYLFLREEYRVSLEEGVENETLRQLYLDSKSRYESLLVKSRALEAVTEQLQERYEALREGYEELYSKARSECERELTKYRIKVFVLRFGVAVPLVALGLFSARIASGGRWELHASAFLAYAILLLGYAVLVFTWSTAQVIGVSLLGAITTGAGLYWIRREYYKPERMRLSRALSGRCPYCNSRVGEGYDYCPSCGSRVVVECKQCGNKVRAYLRHCPFCGSEL